MIDVNKIICNTLLKNSFGTQLETSKIRNSKEEELNNKMSTH
jgi:hypothetical protein